MPLWNKKQTIGQFIAKSYKKLEPYKLWFLGSRENPPPRFAGV